MNSLQPILMSINPGHRLQKLLADPAYVGLIRDRFEVASKRLCHDKFEDRVLLAAILIHVAKEHLLDFTWKEILAACDVTAKNQEVKRASFALIKKCNFHSARMNANSALEIFLKKLNLQALRPYATSLLDAIKGLQQYDPNTWRLLAAGVVHHIARARLSHTLEMTANGLGVAYYTVKKGYQIFRTLAQLCPSLPNVPPRA